MTAKEAKQWHYTGTPMEFEVPPGVEGPVYCVGDSHVLVLQNVFPKVFHPSHWGFDDAETVFQSKTAYAVGSDGHSEYLEKSYRSIPTGSKVLMSFGGIDCSHYLPKRHAKHGTSLETLTDEVIERYKAQCLSVFQNKYRLMVLGAYVTPHDHHHRNELGGEVWCNAYEKIFEAKLILNGKLEKYCDETGALFIPIWRVSQEEQWDRQPIGTFFGDDTHASGCMVPVILNAMQGFKWRGHDT